MIRFAIPALAATGIAASAHAAEVQVQAQGPVVELSVSETVDAKPDIVLVALGCPKQERLIDTLRNDFPDSWFFGIGISLSFVTGDVKRAPTLIRRLGLEWVHRLLQEPGRLAKRYILVGIPFACRVLTGSVLARFRG